MKRIPAALLVLMLLAACSDDPSSPGARRTPGDGTGQDVPPDSTYEPPYSRIDAPSP